MCSKEKFTSMLARENKGNAAGKSDAAAMAEVRDVLHRHIQVCVVWKGGRGRASPNKHPVWPHVTDRPHCHFLCAPYLHAVQLVCSAFQCFACGADPFHLSLNKFTAFLDDTGIPNPERCARAGGAPLCCVEWCPKPNRVWRTYTQTKVLDERVSRRPDAHLMLLDAATHPGHHAPRAQPVDQEERLRHRVHHLLLSARQEQRRDGGRCRRARDAALSVHGGAGSLGCACMSIGHTFDAGAAARLCTRRRVPAHPNMHGCVTVLTLSPRALLTQAALAKYGKGQATDGVGRAVEMLFDRNLGLRLPPQAQIVTNDFRSDRLYTEEV